MQTKLNSKLSLILYLYICDNIWSNIKLFESILIIIKVITQLSESFAKLIIKMARSSFLGFLHLLF